MLNSMLGTVSYLWRNERSRSISFQFLLLAALLALILEIFFNTVENLENAGLASGYGFLFQTSAFDINQRLIEYDSTHTYGKAFIVGGLIPSL